MAANPLPRRRTIQRGLHPAAVLEDLFARNGWAERGVTEFMITFIITRASLRCWALREDAERYGSAATMAAYGRIGLLLSEKTSARKP